MMLVVLLGLGWLCAPLGALVMDFSVKNSADEQEAQEVTPAREERAGCWICMKHHSDRVQTVHLN